MKVGSWIYQLDAAVIAGALALGMCLGAWLGERVGARRPEPTADSGAAATGILGLLGLLLAFTFGMAGTRYEAHRELIVREANAIATVAMRADMYAEPDRSAFRREVNRYLEARIADNEAGMESSLRLGAERTREAAQRELWTRAATLSRQRDYLAATNQMVPALNEMFDVASLRLAAERGYVPEVVIALLFFSCLVGTFYAAYFASRAAHYDWTAMLGFTGLAAAVVFVALDLERPRRGLIDLRVSHQSMIEVRSLLKSPGAD